jgi:hypothetical protein
MTVQSPQGTPPPPPYNPAPPAKKGMGPLGWVAIGCGIIVVLGAIVVGGLGWLAKRQVDKFADNPGMAAAEMIVKMNPELELVKSDRDAGTLTVRNKKTNEVVTVDLEDAKSGNISFSSDEGGKVEVGEGGMKVTDEKGQVSTIGIGGGQPPSWLSTYPGGTSQSTFDTNTAEGHSGAFTVSTSDSIEQVADYYESELEAAGLKVIKNTMQTDGKTSGGSVNGTSEDEKRSAGVMLAVGDDGGTTAIVTFTEKP